MLCIVHAGELIGRRLYTIGDLATVLAVTPGTVRKSTRRLSRAVPPRKDGYSPTPPSIVVHTGERVEITEAGKDVMKGAAVNPALDHDLSRWREMVLSGCIEEPGPAGPRLRPAPISAAVLPTGGVRGGRKADAEAAAMLDYSRAAGCSVGDMIEKLCRGELRWCRKCGLPLPLTQYDGGRRVCEVCRKEQRKPKDRRG